MGHSRRMLEHATVGASPWCRMKNLLLAIFAAVAAAPLLAAAPKHADVLIRHATLVDVERARLVRDQAVVTAGDRIVTVGKDADVARDWTATRIIEAKDR